jgi:hypothetical protein
MGFYAKDEPACPVAERPETETLSRDQEPRPGNAIPPSFTVGIGHRFYSPSLGRWVSRDPINEPAFDLSFASAEDSEDEELLADASEYLQVAEAIDRSTGKGRAVQMGNFVRQLQKDAALASSSVRDSPAERNLYLGMFNDPILRFDPFGLDARAIAAELCQMDGPYKIGDAIGLAIIACCVLAEPHGCYPCTPPVGTVGYRGPETHSHWPFSKGSTHYHVRVMNQSPWPMCRCFWATAVPYTVATPPPGSTPIPPPPYGGGAY